MAKFSGKIGYGMTSETSADVWSYSIVEHPHRGDWIRTSRSYQQSNNSTIDGIRLTNQLSIVADPFAYANYPYMKYVLHNGIKWKIESVEFQRPRVIITLGGAWNENEATV